MIQLIPTILTNDKNVFQKQYTAFSAFSPRLQIDICDGFFTPTKTIEITDIVPNPQGPKLDFHLMMSNPAAILNQLIALKPNLVIIHAEIGLNLTQIFATLKQAGIKTGLALLPQTFPGKYANYLKTVDHCLIFAGQLGQQGGHADMLQTEKVPLVRAINEKLEIGWDGGANMSNIRALAHVGLDVINIGSAISNAADPKKALAELSSEMDKNGVII